MANTTPLEQVKKNVTGKNATLVAVSKLQPVTAIQNLYNQGQRDFGENYVQELLEKAPLLPGDTRWHFIGHLQSNKVKYIVPFVHLIQSVDSEKLLHEINRQAGKSGKTVNCLLQIHIAQEETKFGFDMDAANDLLHAIMEKTIQYEHVAIKGFMAMASNTTDETRLGREFAAMHTLFEIWKNRIPGFDTLSMGMSGDYKSALAHGSNMVRIGSLLFGARH